MLRPLSQHSFPVLCRQVAHDVRTDVPISAPPVAVDVTDPPDVTRRRYAERYEPAWQIYVAKELPASRADMIVDNRDFLHPQVSQSNGTLAELVNFRLERRNAIGRGLPPGRRSAHGKHHGAPVAGVGKARPG